MLDFENIDVNEWTDLIVMYGLRIVAAFAILIIGWMVAKFIRRISRNALKRAHIDQTLSNFLSNIVYAIAIAFVLVATLNKVGVQTASLVAIIGAAGLAIGLALQGSLSNFAAGVMIILFKHFKVGDYIEADGVDGTVQNLDIFNTTLVTPNNQTIIIPNSKLTDDAIINYSEQLTRRIDTVVGIGYDDDIDLAKRSILDEISKITEIKTDPPPMVAVKELGASSVNLVVRCWTDTADYWNSYFLLLENIKKRLDKEGVSIPYPQTDIHIYNKTNVSN